MRLPKLVRDERGATAIEYGLIAALISMAAVIAFAALGLNLATVLQSTADIFNGKVS